MKKIFFACLFAVASGTPGFCFAQELPEAGHVERLYGSYAPIVLAILGGLISLGKIGLIALPFQLFLPAIKRKPKIFSYEFWLDTLYWMQSIWLGLISFYAISDWLVVLIYRESGPWWPALAALPFWLQVLLAIWAFDFIVYWRHRFEHKWPLLWSFHAVHHTTEKVDFMTTIRLHPFELILGAVLNAAVIRTGIHPAAAGLGFMSYLYYNYFIHTNVRIRFSGIWKYVLVSPFMHQWHHAKDKEAIGKNVGVVFAWNDWLFGTAYHPKHWPTEFGFTGAPSYQVGQSYIRHLLYPLQYYYARFKTKRAKRARAAQQNASMGV